MIEKIEAMNKINSINYNLADLTTDLASAAVDCDLSPMQKARFKRVIDIAQELVPYVSDIHEGFADEVIKELKQREQRDEQN